MRIALTQRCPTPDTAFNIERGINDIRTAAEQGAQLIVFPELAFLPFFPQYQQFDTASQWAEPIPGQTTNQFSRLAEETGTVIVLNIYEKSNNLFYDSSPVIDSTGDIVGVTRMVHIIEAPAFHETQYYSPGDNGASVYDTSLGKLGVAICYDRHFPEYMRALGTKGADLVVVPQAGAAGEWPAGVFEAEMQIAGFQNGYFTALANRVGNEEHLNFAGRSFVTDPMGRVIAQLPKGKEGILYADLDLALLYKCPARTHFLKDRRPEIYPL